MCRLNLDGRLVRLSEAHAALVVAAFDRALNAVALDRATRTTLRLAMADELRVADRAADA